MAPTLLTAPYQETAQHIGSQQVIEQMPLHGERGAVSFVELDNFKTLNDTLGHEADDRVLIRLAKILSNNVRATDTVARLGGNEYVILMVRTQADEAVQCASCSPWSTATTPATARPGFTCVLVWASSPMESAMMLLS